MDNHDGLWDLASADLVAENRAHRLTAAKVSAAEFWPFLALASDPTEFEHRLSLVASDLTERVEADLHDQVLASLRQDYRSVTAGGYDPDGWADRQREMYPEKHDPAGDYADGTKSRDEPKSRGTVNGADYDAIQKHLPEGSPYRKQSGKEGAWWEDEGEKHPYADTPAPTSQEISDDNDDSGPHYSMWDHTDGPSSSSGGLVISHPSGWSAVTSGDNIHVHHKNAAREPGLTYFHAGLGRWVSADDTATMTPANPNYFLDSRPEQGPNTDPSGQTAAPDPVNRTLDQYDHAMPGVWQERTPWIEQGNAATGQAIASRRTAAPQEMGYWRDGQQNPGYFDQGSEGITGDGSTLAPPPMQGNPDAGGIASGGPDGSTSAEPIEARSDWYGEMTGQQQASPGSTEADGTEGQSFEPGSRRGARRVRANAYPGVDDPEAIQDQLNRTPLDDVHRNLQSLEQSHPDHDLTKLLRDHLEVRRLLGTPGRPFVGSRRPFGHDVGSQGVPGVRAEASASDDDDLYEIGTSSRDHLRWRQNHEPAVEKLKDQYEVRSDGVSRGVQPFVPGDQSHRHSSFFDPHDASVHSVGYIGGAGEPGSELLNSMSGAGGEGDQNTPQTGGDTGGGLPGAETAGGAGDALSGASNTPQSPGTPGGGGGGGNLLDGSTPKLSRRVTAEGDDSGGQGPSAPPQMQPGGPGAQASPPMKPSAIGQPGGPGQVPQTTKPRQTPGSGGAGAPGGPGQNNPGASAPGGAAGGGSAPGVPKSGRWVQGRWVLAEGPNRAVETPDDPTGLGDEFAAGAYEKQMEQRPRQDMESRRPNTPQKSRDPIPTVSSPGLPGGGEEDEDRREASRVARAAVARALAGAR